MIVKLTAAEMRERERLRKQISERIGVALKRGWRATTIGVLLTNDTTLLAKLENPKHNFLLNTLRVINTRLSILDNEPPVPTRSQRFLGS